MSNKNKYIIYGVLVVVLVVILVVMATHKKAAQGPAGTVTSTNKGSNTALPPVPHLTESQTSAGQLPANFPPKLPIEKNPQVLQNETISNATTGKQDAQYIYVTKQSLSQNLAAFQKYLAANKWQITSTVTQPGFDALNASQASTTLSVILDYKSAAPQNQVSLNYVY